MQASVASATPACANALTKNVFCSVATSLSDNTDSLGSSASTDSLRSFRPFVFTLCTQQLSVAPRVSDKTDNLRSSANTGHLRSSASTDGPRSSANTDRPKKFRPFVFPLRTAPLLVRVSLHTRVLPHDDGPPCCPFVCRGKVPGHGLCPE